MRRGRVRRREQGWIAMAALALMAAPWASALAQATCERMEFETVVTSAADALRSITQQNSPPFQAKLRALKDKRGWSHDQFMAEGTRFVRDDKITAFDEKSGDLLARINDAGGGNGAPSQGNCAQLADLKANMAALVEIQTAKWSYMFANIDAELAR
jgi:hypothetical protein